MIDIIKDSVITFGRIITIFPLLLFITIFMGKRAVGQLPIFDLLIIISLGSVVGADIADPSVNHIPTAVAIITLGVFQRIVAKWKISNRKIGKMITFEPTVVVKNGMLLRANLKKIRYSIDDILQMLRQKDIFDVNDVDIAIIEANGSLSVYKKADKQSPTLDDLNIIHTKTSPAFPIIVEGKVYPDVLYYLNLDQTWLQQQLSLKGINDFNDVFFASINYRQELHVCTKNETQPNTPEFHH